MQLDILAVFLGAFAVAFALAVAVRVWWQRGKIVDMSNGVSQDEASLAGKALRAHRKKGNT